ncbi:MAG: hypothetical protein F6J89_02175 [Symploca sp. SIO1C4]|uniref:Uncharacterized protein n=1 Tax=Symploca sp. SIO1C4 TaxID=2607765 RepID=A0A6B3NBA1_9CYAN|nr:hypothetical protein [Symploca sp. SIO1C4]
MYYPYNQGYQNLVFENDLEDFKLPYLIVGKLDREIMQQRYVHLQKKSYGVISRTGKEIKQWFDYG